MYTTYTYIINVIIIIIVRVLGPFIEYFMNERLSEHCARRRGGVEEYSAARLCVLYRDPGTASAYNGVTHARRGRRTTSFYVYPKTS